MEISFFCSHLYWYVNDLFISFIIQSLMYYSHIRICEVIGHIFVFKFPLSLEAI